MILVIVLAAISASIIIALYAVIIYGMFGELEDALDNHDSIGPSTSG